MHRFERRSVDREGNEFCIVRDVGCREPLLGAPIPSLQL
jgi:hypothetical protein